MNTRKKIIVIGASSAIAHECSRLWAQDGPCDFLLVTRTVNRSESFAADLRTRHANITAKAMALCFSDVDAILALVKTATADGPVDTVLIAHGALPVQTECQKDLHAAEDALQTNGLSTVLIAEAFVSAMQRLDHGHLCIIGSVAGDRGRKSNYIYGAAKGLVERYAQGLQHRLALAGSSVRVTLAKPGPTDTPMTAHLKQGGAKLASAETVARCIVKGIKAGSPVVYAPRKWQLIMAVIQHLPRFIFNRIDI